jgi:hypothetical protein
MQNFPLTNCSPIFGKYGAQIGPKFCFNFGAVLQVRILYQFDIKSFLILFNRAWLS